MSVAVFVMLLSEIAKTDVIGAEIRNRNRKSMGAKLSFGKHNFSISSSTMEFLTPVNAYKLSRSFRPFYTKYGHSENMGSRPPRPFPLPTEVPALNSLTAGNSTTEKSGDSEVLNVFS